MVDKPIGLKQSSPMVSKNIVPTNQNGETKPPEIAKRLAKDITRKPPAASNNAMINLLI